MRNSKLNNHSLLFVIYLPFRFKHFVNTSGCARHDSGFALHSGTQEIPVNFQFAIAHLLVIASYISRWTVPLRQNERAVFESVHLGLESLFVQQLSQPGDSISESQACQRRAK